MAEKKVIDIASPNDAKVDIGSKPMIVGHKTLASDPMVRENAENAEGLPDEEELKQKMAESIVEPIDTGKSQLKQDVPVVSKEQPEIDKPDLDEVNIDPKEPEQKKAEPATLSKDELAKKENNEAIRAMEREENLRKIIASKQYRVSIKQARGSKRALYVLLVLVVLGGFIAGYLMVDAGKLNIGFDVPFSVIDEKNSNDQLATIANAPASSGEQKKEVEEKIQAISTDWLLYDTPDYSIKVPDGWELIAEADSPSSLYATAVLYAEGKKAVVAISSTALNSSVKESSVFNLKVSSDLGFEFCSKNYVEGDVSTIKTENGLTVYKKSTKISGGMENNYCMQVDKKVYSATYQQLSDDQDQTNIVEELLSSIKSR